MLCLLSQALFPPTFVRSFAQTSLTSHPCIKQHCPPPPLSPALAFFFFFLVLSTTQITSTFLGSGEGHYPPPPVECNSVAWDLRCFVCCHAPSTRQPAWCVWLVLSQWVLNESLLTASLAQGASRGRVQADVHTDLGSSPGPVTSPLSLVSHTAVVRIEDNMCLLSTQHLTVHTVVRFPLAQHPGFPVPHLPQECQGRTGCPVVSAPSFSLSTCPLGGWTPVNHFSHLPWPAGFTSASASEIGSHRTNLRSREPPGHWLQLPRLQPFLIP